MVVEEETSSTIYPSEGILITVAWINERRASKTEAGRKASLTRIMFLTKHIDGACAVFIK